MFFYFGKDNNAKTLEDLQKEYQESKNKTQEEFVEKILSDVKWLCEKSQVKSYVPTQKERDSFSEIVTIVNNMNKWF